MTSERLNPVDSRKGFVRAMITLVSIALTGLPSCLFGQFQFAYVVNLGSNLGPNTVSGYTINATTGALSPIAGSPFAAGDGPVSIAVDPTGRFAYVANEGIFGGPSVSGYTINATTGALSPIPGSPFTAGSTPVSVAVDPTGRFAYVANLSSSNISGYTINATTGVLTPIPGSPFPNGSNSVPRWIAVDPTAKFAYVPNVLSLNISGYTINATTGALSPVPGSPFAGDRPFSDTVDPTGRFAYVANGPVSSEVSGYTINATTGALSPIPGSPFAAGDGPVSIAVDPTGRFAYVANEGVFGASSISGYTINATTGALSPVPGSPFPSGRGARSVAVDLTGKFAYVANSSSNNVSEYTINPTTGALTPIGTVAAGIGPNSVAVSRLSRPPFAGTPGTASCHGESVSALAEQFGGLDAAAGALGYASVQALQNAIRAFCQ